MVKFGHQLLADSRSLHDVFALLGFSAEVMNYKQYKKLLKVSMANMEEAVHVLPEKVQLHLTDPYWNWMLTAPCLKEVEVSSAFAWFWNLLQANIQQEAEKIKSVIEEMHFRILALKQHAVDLESGISQSEQPLNDLLQLRKLWQDTTLVEDGIRRFRLINLTGFCKILKKFDKNWGHWNGHMCAQTLMPFIIETVSLPETMKRTTSETWDKYLQKANERIKAAVPDKPGIQEQLQMLQSVHVKQMQELMADGTVENDEPAISQAISKEGLSRWLPVAAALRSYSWQSFRSDFMAALVISIAGIPKAMGYANLASLPVASGIATLYVPNLLYALLGSSRQGATSPQSVPALLLGQMVTETLSQRDLEDTVEHRIALTMMYTLLTGIMLILIGSLRITFLLNFVSKSVLSGFVSASVVVAALSTVKTFLQVSIKKSPAVHVTLSNLLAKLPEAHTGTVVMSALAVTSMMILGRLQKKATNKLAGKRGMLLSLLRQLIRIPAAIWVVLAGIYLGANLCDFQAFTEWQPIHKVMGRGATFPADFFHSVGQAFECQYYNERLLMEYQATGSGDGLKTVETEARLRADFATSDVKPTEFDLARYDLLAYPTVSSVVCPVVNIPMIPGSHQIQLILDLPTVAGIFSGKIRSWADPQIKSLNPNLPWHTERTELPIKVISRSDDSGTTHTFSTALAECTGCNASVAPGMQVDWQANIAFRAQSNKAVVDLVRREAWSIGYASLNELRQQEAKRTSAACVALKMQGEVVTTSKSLWPIRQTNYLLIPASHDRPVDAEPRQTGCKARQLLYQYTAMLYSSRELEMEDMVLLPRPKDLHLILCPTDRHLDSHRRLPSTEKCSSAVTAPTCQDYKMVGFVPPSIPDFQLPSFELLPLSGSTLLNVALLSIVVLLEHVAVVKRFAAERNYEVWLSSDICALGFANVVGSMFGSFFVAAGFSRSSLNSSAETQMSLLLSVLLSLGILYLVAPLLSMLPDAFVAVVLFMAVIGSFDWGTLLELWKLGRHGLLDSAALFLAFGTTCFFGVIPGMSLAVGFSIVMFILNSSFSEVVQLGRVPGTQHYEAVQSESSAVACAPSSACKPSSGGGQKSRSQTITFPSIKVLSPRAPLWFGNVARFMDILKVTLRLPKTRAVVVDMSCAPWIDATACAEIRKVLEFVAEGGQDVRFANASVQVQQIILAGCGQKGCSQLFYESILEAEICMSESQVLDTFSDNESNESAEEHEHAKVAPCPAETCSI
eukprot:TRINITY_DN64639_c0_g1_i1.p1 TRINITY_DN64639_c0_g1~~TRINITY_DN64639_c0_g1_i1.p1  ORF type:complete len:1247 (-),score=238.45 TRINITY_DN64639_c0_g1_i1:170-3910(-)